MSVPSATVRGPPPGGGGGTAQGIGGRRPGLLVSGIPPECHQRMLEYMLYTANNSAKIKHVVFSQTKEMAYIELTDPSVIPSLLSQRLTNSGKEITLKKIDLLEVWKPYLIVQGFPHVCTHSMLEGHFKAMGMHAELELIDLNTLEGQCRVSYKNPMVTLEVASRPHEILGSRLQVALAYNYPAPVAQEESALTITFTGLPPAMQDANIMRQTLDYYFESLGYNLVSCEIINGSAYVTFPDPSAVHKIASSPPTATFIAGCKLEYSAIPASKLQAIRTMQGATLPVNIQPSSHNVQQVPSPDKSLHPGYMYGANPVPHKPFSSSPASTSVHAWGQPSSPAPLQSQNSPVTSYQPHYQNPSASVGSMQSNSSSQNWASTNSFISYGFVPQNLTDSQTHLQDSVGSTSSVFSQGSTQPQAWDPEASAGSVSSRMSRTSSTSSQHSADLNVHYSSTGPNCQPVGQWQGSNYQQPPHKQPMFTIAEQPIQASTPGTSPQKQFTHSQLVVEDMEAPCGQPLPDAISTPTKILINGIPAEERSETTLMYYLQSLLAPQAPNCNVKLYGEKAVATFIGTISVNTLAQLASQQLYAGKHMLSFSMIEPSNYILVSGVTNQTDYCLKLYFQRISGMNTVTNVEHLSSTHVRITFNSCQCIQAVLKQEKHEVDGVFLSAVEYYPFMNIEEIDSPETLTAPVGPSVQSIPKPLSVSPRPIRHAWSSHREQLTKEKCMYVHKTLGKLTTALEMVKANVTVEENSSTVVISPVQLSGDISDWDIQVQKILNKHLSTYEEKSLEVPKEALTEVYLYIMEVTGNQTEVYVYRKDEKLTIIAGRSDLVEEVFEKVSDLCESCQISQREIPLSKKHIRYLEKFCKQDLDSMNPPVQYSLDANSQCVRVTASPQSHAAFLELVQQKTASAVEKSLTLTIEQRNLLLSKMKIRELLGTTLSHVVYEFEETSLGDGKVTHVLVFLSSSEVPCKAARKIIKPYLHSVSLQVSPQKIRACSDQKWRALVSKLTDDNFALITVVEERKEIIITGDKTLIEDMKKQIEDFLSEHTSVDERVKVDLNVWKVISMNFEKEIEGVKSQAKTKKVIIRWPSRSTNDSGIEIIIRGEPDGVDDIKAQVEMLKVKVHMKEEKVAGVPAVVQVLHSVEDKLHVLETQHKVAIEVSLESGQNGSSDTGERPRKVCSATAQDGSRVSIYTGDFTQNNDPVGTIVSFITPNPDVQVGNFRLLSSAGGDEVERDFRSKIAQFMELKPNTVFKTKHGQLRCTQLLHCVLPSWDDGDQQNKTWILEEAIKNILQNASIFGSLLLTPITSMPLQYPAEVFAQKFMDVITNRTASNSSLADIQVAIYVDELSHAEQFQQLLSTNNFQIHTRVPSVGSSSPAPQRQCAVVTKAKAISSPISSFITLTCGDMLQQQAEVYINSTNSDLELKNGQLSNLLLKACGDELQQECSAYTPLNPGEVAVTSAKNLKCDQIYHVALPDYKTRNSERTFRDTVRTILRTAKSSGVSSIAIPSLGVANLSYPASVSARILLDELIAFHNANPSTSVKNFHLVIYDKSTHQVFSKEYASKMSSRNASPPQQRKPDQSGKTHKQGGTQLSIVQGNIADEKTDVIVNTTTAEMELSASAASRALLKKAGPNLQSMCKQLVLSGCKLEHGQIAVTKGFDLHCNKVIHAHLPFRNAAVRASIDHQKLIEEIVTDCLERTEKEGMHSISFPAFGLGQGGYSTPEIADPMLKAIKKFSEVSTRSVCTIRVVILDQNLFQEFFDFHCKFFGLSQAAASGSQSLFQSLKSKFGLGQSMDATSVQLGSESTAPSVSATASAATPALQAIFRSVRNPIAVFHIFAVSSQECDRITSQIRAILKEKAITEKIENEEIIEHLIDDDVDEIRHIGDNLGVDVRFMSKMKEVHISGEKSNVLEAKLQVTSILNEAEKAKAELTMYMWQSDDNGHIKPYSEGASIRLERACAKNLQAIEMVIDSNSTIIDLQSMQEINKSSGKTRKVARVKRKLTVDYPDTWENETLKDGRPLPMEMFDVPSRSPEYQLAIKEFEATINYSHYTIECVKRIQNRIEYTKHIAFRDAIEAKHGMKVEQRKLFHGSKLDSLELIATQGFNRNFAASANAAYFGKGVYFAANAYYSAQLKYAAADTSGCQYMLVCNFVVGKYTRGTPKMIVAPTLAADTKDVFDTLVDNEQNPTIFVAMKDSQAYPEYLIKFKIDRSKK